MGSHGSGTNNCGVTRQWNPISVEWDGRAVGSKSEGIRVMEPERHRIESLSCEKRDDDDDDDGGGVMVVVVMVVIVVVVLVVVLLLMMMKKASQENAPKPVELMKC